MVFKHYLNKDYTWNEIDRIGKATPGKGMWNVPFDVALAREGVRIRNIERTDFEALYRDGEQYLRTAYGPQNAEYYIKRSNVLDIREDIPKFLRLIPHESRPAGIEETLQYLIDGTLIAAEINAGALNGTGKFNLHMVLLYGFENGSILLHDPGLPPQPNRKITVSEFGTSFAYDGASQGIDVFSMS